MPRPAGPVACVASCLACVRCFGGLMSMDIEEKWERATSSKNEEEGKENAKNPVTPARFMGSLFWLTLQMGCVC